MPAAPRSMRPRDGVRLRGAFLPACLAAVLPAMLSWAAPAAAQMAPPGAVAMPAFDPGQIRPFDQPQRLALFHVPAFRFAAETLNLGAPMPNAPARVLAQGAGSVARGPMTTGWILTIERLTLDGQVIAAAMPLATLTVSVGNDAPAQRFYRAEYPGLDTLPQAPPRSPIRRIVRRLVDTIAFALPTPPVQPVADRSPVADIGVALQRYVSQALPDAQIVQPPAPAVAVGLVDRFARPGLLARQEGPFAIRAAYRDTVLRSEAVGVIDLATALPLFVQARIFGPVDLPFLRGPVDYALRVAIALPGMDDPAKALAPPRAMPASAAPQTAAPRPAPRQPEASTRPAPAAAPAPKPRAPAATPPAAPAAPGEAVKRLETLKSLYDRGLITKEQYEAKQKEILGAL